MPPPSGKEKGWRTDLFCAMMGDRPKKEVPPMKTRKAGLALALALALLLTLTACGTQGMPI